MLKSATSEWKPARDGSPRNPSATATATVTTPAPTTCYTLPAMYLPVATFFLLLLLLLLPLLVLLLLLLLLRILLLLLLRLLRSDLVGTVLQ